MATLDKRNAEKHKKKKKGGMDEAINSNERIRQWTDHIIGQRELADQLQTKLSEPGSQSFFGLTDEEAAKRLQLHGPNALSEKKQLPWIVKFLLTMTGLFNYLLWVGAALSFLTYGVNPDKRDPSNLYLGIVLVGVIILSAIFTYYQEAKAASMMAQFKNFIPPEATVFRGGIEKTVAASSLVPGDIVLIKNGENVPADVVLIKTTEMKVNNSSLTGESKELLRDPNSKKENIFESPNVAFFGTACTNGSGYGIIFKTGDNTVIGQIATLASSAETVETPIAKEIDRFIKIISCIAISSGLFFFCIDFAYNYPILTNIIFMIGIIVANMPEGLLITVTVCMALAAQRMAARKVLVKNLQSVETLGSTSCICSDKTGTLTQNKMTVSHMYFNRQIIDASVNYEDHKKHGTPIEYDPNDPAFKALLQTIALGSSANFSYVPTLSDMRTYHAKKQGKKPIDFQDVELTEAEKKEATEALLKQEKEQPIANRQVKGDASETGLVKFCHTLMPIDQARGKYPVFNYEQDGKQIECFIPFSSEIKFNLYVRDMNENVKNPKNADDGLWIVMKGAPERILNRCNKILVNGEELDFDEDCRQEVNDANDAFGKMGERVLAFAICKLDPKVFTKSPAYQFDFADWKSWLGVKKNDGTVKGWFPMWDLTLVGVISLNDPPRPKVAYSVDKCRRAGIKVIMVTGDQPPTAAAIAHKVNIISDPKLEYHYLKDEMGMSHEDAWAMSKAIVIHGDNLAQKHLAEEGLDDADPEKGRFLQEWISKPEVVFARTTPSQKLLIVNACQKAGHIVAVTGDGVNDSPAIKKADIGIAMGSGSDVAKNAADILLLDDDFSSIVIGVEQGRVMFDNLKKSVCYALTVNIPELAPVLMFILFQVPVPLSSILMLVICIGTDMAPSISLAYENGELDIMERMPRNSKRDHLVTAKLICFTYLQTGIAEFSAGMFTYFYVLNDYGYKFTTVTFLNQEPGYYPDNNDVYDPTQPNYGNSNYGVSSQYAFVNWGLNVDNKMDARLFYVFMQRTNWATCRWDPQDESIPRFWRYSQVTGKQICYTPEALLYAQGAYFLACLTTQWANLLICKTRVLSLSQQGMTNYYIHMALAIETAIALIISYVKPLEVGLNCRAVACSHFVVPAMSHFAIIFLYDEVRKIYVRSGIDRSVKGKVKLEGWFARNTLW